jgi:acyl carrier protein
MLDRASFEMGKSWSEGGGDSLKAMELIFLIERALDFRVPLELLDESTRPKALIGALHRLLAPSCQSNGSGRAAAHVPLVFLMPGIGGDEPALASMRDELGTRIRFVTIKYPSSSAMIEAEARFDAIADAVVAQVRWAAKSDEVIHLAGYSFGGFVVLEVACRLLAAGCRIGAIGLIDARRERVVASLEQQRKFSSRVRSAIRNILLRPWQSANTILYLAKYSFISRLPLVLLWLLHSLAPRLPSWMAVGLPRKFDRELQRRAVRADCTASEVRRLAKRAKDAAQARRLLAIAAVLDGASREDAAKIGGMDRQTLRDLVILFNESPRVWSEVVDAMIVQR